ncbi:hypothetical protein HU200_023147 [Digitaria exilis]|uniref:EGF-like domain-containing protein n=1 Tax=Digitaria exilis TaxID=1010633 RepID=A0A835CCY4_9POAL|nr:hypothetical protein HU200_023147 [Digitaria exilis]CAB3497002.1 unnamed protein product [Digitaria exilis]CAB3501949.1 unnamed protein product [Digitaria exilis]
MLAAGRRSAALVALLLAVAATAAVSADGDDFFSPLAPIFAPVINSICSTVACGKGNCTVAPGTLGYRCECDPGWTQLHVGDNLRFLPCVIPNCSIDSTCSNGSSAPAPTPLPSPKNFSLDPCELAYCGSGGTCRNGSGLSYHCDCKEGYSNLLNMTTMPCFQNCSIGADCSRIGLPISNSSDKSPAPPGSESIYNNGNAATPGSISERILLPLLLLVSLSVGQVI